MLKQILTQALFTKFPLLLRAKSEVFQFLKKWWNLRILEHIFYVTNRDFPVKKQIFGGQFQVPAA